MVQPVTPVQRTGTAINPRIQRTSKEPTVAKKYSITLTEEQAALLATLLGALQALQAGGVIEAPEAEEAESEDDAEEESDESEDEEESEEEESDEADESEEEESEDEESGESEDEEESDGPDKEDVRKELKKLVATDKPAAIALLKKFKAKTLDDVAEEKYEDLIKAIKKALK